MLRVFTVYRLCATKGSTSCYVQHLRHFVKAATDRDPREALMVDLREDVTKGIEAGDNIIIMENFNESVRGMQ